MVFVNDSICTAQFVVVIIPLCVIMNIAKQGIRLGHERGKASFQSVEGISGT